MLRPIYGPNTGGDSIGPSIRFAIAACSMRVSSIMEDAGEADLPLYMGAAHALVIPHFPIQNVGTLETAIMAFRMNASSSHLRFHALTACFHHNEYTLRPASRTSLIQAMAQAQFHNHRLKEKEVDALDAHSGWSKYAQRMLERYQHLLS